MVAVRDKVSDTSLVRIGAYSQMEGNFRIGVGDKTDYRFTFFLNQISDMKELIDEVIAVGADKLIKRNTYIQFYSKQLYRLLSELGFIKFGARDWNVPRCIYQSESSRREYLRAVVDSLGDVDIDRSTPYIRICSVNRDGLLRLSDIFDGTFYEHGGTNYLQWHGKECLRIGGYLEWKFYCHRNIRGAELIVNANWDALSV